MISFLRDLVTRDFWLKLFSLALAVLIWVTLSIAKEGGLGKHTSEETCLIPVRMVSSSMDVSAFKARPDEVQVRIRGITRKLQELRAGDVRALVDLTGVQATNGLHKRIEIITPPDFTVLQVIPEDAEVVLPPPPPPPHPTIFFNH